MTLTKLRKAAVAGLMALRMSGLGIGGFLASSPQEGKEEMTKPVKAEKCVKQLQGTWLVISAEGVDDGLTTISSPATRTGASTGVTSHALPPSRAPTGSSTSRASITASI
jgi:hypothetical protein